MLRPAVRWAGEGCIKKVETRIRSEDMDHVNVKIYVQEPTSIDLRDAIPVFHRWIQDAVLNELVIDVA